MLLPTSTALAALPRRSRRPPLTHCLLPKPVGVPPLAAVDQIMADEGDAAVAPLAMHAIGNQIALGRKMTGSAAAAVGGALNIHLAPGSAPVVIPNPGMRHACLSHPAGRDDGGGAIQLSSEATTSLDVSARQVEGSEAARQDVATGEQASSAVDSTRQKNAHSSSAFDGPPSLFGTAAGEVFTLSTSYNSVTVAPSGRGMVRVVTAR